MYEANLREEILQSTQRLMNQIDQIKPVEINLEDIEKSHAFLQSIDDEQISNIEKSHSLLRDVSSWGDRRMDEYNEFEKPLLNTVEKSVFASEEVTRSAIPLLQEKIDNYDRQLGNIKSSIVTMSDAITKTAKETYEMARNGNDPNAKLNSDQNKGPVLLAFTSASFSLQEKHSTEENSEPLETSEDPEISANNNNIIRKDDKTNYDIFQKMKAREEHLLKVIKSMSDQQIDLENSLKAEQINSKNLQFQLDYVKKLNYSPELAIDEDSLLSTNQYTPMHISQNNSSTISYEIPEIVLKFNDKNEDTKELEKEILMSNQKIISIQNFQVFSVNHASDFDQLKHQYLNDHQKEYQMNLIDQGIQHSNEAKYDFKNVQTEQIGPIENTVAIIKGDDDHHIFAYPEHLNQNEIEDDVNDLINFHRSVQDNPMKNCEEEEDICNSDEIDQEMRLKNLKMITDFTHAADVVLNTKSGERSIITEDNIRLGLTKHDSKYEFTSKNGQLLSVNLVENNDQQVKGLSNLEDGEVVENRKILLANETNKENEQIELEVIINKSGESFISNNNIDKVFMDYEGRTFIFDSTGKNKVYVLMNDEGKIIYETRNGQMIQIAMHNMNPDLYFINEDGEQIAMKLDEYGNFYTLSKNGQRIVIDFNSKPETHKKPSQTPTQIQEPPQPTKERAKIEEKIINQLEERLSRPNTTSNSTELLVPVSISRKGNEMKIIYKDCQDAVVVNTTISHMTEDGQIILNNGDKNTKSDEKIPCDSYTRITRILGGFERSFIGQSNRKNFNWSLAPIGLSVEGNSCSSIVKLTNSKLGSRTNKNSTYEIQQSDTSIRWRSFPIRPPPPCCRKLQAQLELSYPSKKNSPMPLINIAKNKNSVIVPIDPNKRKNVAMISSYESSPRRQKLRNKLNFPSNVLLDVENPTQMISNLSPRIPNNQKVSENHVSNSQNVSITKIELPQSGF